MSAPAHQPAVVTSVTVPSTKPVGVVHVPAHHVKDDDKKKRWAALGSAIFAAVALVVVFSVALTRKEKDDLDVDRHVNNAKSKLQDVKNKIVSQLQK